MKITFIGTSHGVPAADRQCSCTMLEINGSLYFIDAGASIIDGLLKLDKSANDVRAVFTTHLHADHTFGILHLAELMNWKYKEASADFYLTEQPVIDAMENMISAVDVYVELDRERIRFKLTDPVAGYADENVKVSYIPTKHIAKGNPSYSILVEAEGKRVLFSGDMSMRLEKADFPKLATEQEHDLFVCEMAHFGAEHISPYLAECKAKTVAFTHVFPLNKYDDIAEMRGKYPFEIITPADGDSLEL